jgi:hypothetical protein
MDTQAVLVRDDTDFDVLGLPRENRLSSSSQSVTS